MSVYIPAALQGRVRQRSGNCCVYCRTAEQLTVAIFEFEHIVPRSAGGETALENLCLACPTCNRYKAVVMSAADPVPRETVRLFHPQQDRGQIIFHGTRMGQRLSA